MLVVSTDRSSCFDRNKVALRMELLCDIHGDNICPAGGVGVYNPGYWGMVGYDFCFVLVFCSILILQESNSSPAVIFAYNLTIYFLTFHPRPTIGCHICL